MRWQVRMLTFRCRVVVLFVLLYEEPMLRKMFGAEEGAFAIWNRAVVQLISPLGYF